MAYARMWSRGWASLNALGIGLSLLMWQPVAVAMGFALAMTAAAIALLLLGTSLDDVRPRIALQSWSDFVRMAVTVGITAVAIIAFANIDGWLALALALAAVLSSPWVVLGFTAKGASPRPLDDVIQPESRDLDPSALLQASLASVHDISDSDLCQAWRRSFVALSLASTMQQRLEIVVARQMCLDEIERRNPVALKAWLASGARAAGAPDRYLGTDEGQVR